MSNLAGDHLRSFIERIERLEEEIRDLNSDKSDIYKEAKGQGFDAKIMRKVVAARKLDPSERDENDALFDTYMHALGHGSHAGVPVHSREETPGHDAETGEIKESDPDSTSGLHSSAAHEPDESAAPISTGPHLSAVPGGEPSVPTPDADGAKMASGFSACQAGSGEMPKTESIQSEDAATNQPETATKSGVGPLPGETVAEGPHKAVTSQGGENHAPQFENPRCQTPDACQYAHSYNTCHECIMAWAQRPKDEQSRLWQEAKAKAVPA
ncbi:DUF2312 domain-containing protein [Pararhizobium mangrovi]|uniref:DUF2312 domain-containing protein n=1 Tax=Pararhizobium mangrovi TaxID=2590452 RepID=A0A506TXU1_9HYPH|nr:DUF2312 domain-containing protein [Pararhizobium mangrovi]